MQITSEEPTIHSAISPPCATVFGFVTLPVMAQSENDPIESEAKIQQFVEELLERGELRSAIKGTDELESAVKTLESEFFLPSFPVDYLIRKQFAMGAWRILQSLHSPLVVSTSSKSISWKTNERLFPDLLLSSERGRFVIVEIKKSRQTEREAITELLGYDHELRNHLPFFSKTDVGLTVISTEFSPILCHSLAELAVWEGRDVLCLKASQQAGQIELGVYLPDPWTAIGQHELPEEALKTITLCLYPTSSDDSWEDMILSALFLIVREGERVSGNGFVLLWEDTWFPRISNCRWNVTVGWINPYAFLPRALEDHIVGEPSEVFTSLLENGDFEKMSHEYHPVFQIAEKGISVLSEYCKPRWEGFSTWRQERLDPNALRNRALPVFVDCWGLLGDYVRELFSHPGARRNHMPEIAARKLSLNDPRVGIPILDEICGVALCQGGHFTCTQLFRLGISLGTFFALSKAEDEGPSNPRNLEALFQWTKLDLLPALREMRYRYLGTDEINSEPPVVRFPDFKDKPNLADELQQMVNWVMKDFLEAGAPAHREWFAFGLKAYPLWEPVFAGGKNDQLLRELKTEAVEFSRSWLRFIWKEATESGLHPDARENIVSRLLQFYSVSLKGPSEMAEFDAAVARIGEEEHIDYIDHLAGLVDEVVPEVLHAMTPLHPNTPVDWEWLRGQILKLKEQGVAHPAIAINADGSIVTTELEATSAKMLGSPDLTMQVHVINNLHGIPFVTTESWRDLGAGKTWRKDGLR